MNNSLDELRKLTPLVGKWQSNGTVLPSAATSEIEISGTDTYEWVCDGMFLLHKVDVKMGAEKTEVIEMIGYDPEAKNYPMRSFDNHGDFAVMHFYVNEKGVWKIQGDNVRSTLKVGLDGRHMNALWERTDNGISWIPWMNMRFKRLD